MHDLNFSINLEPKFCNNFPFIKVGLDDKIFFNDYLMKQTIFQKDISLSNGNHCLWIEFLNKTNDDTTTECDKAVIIKEIKFEDFNLPRFIWAGVFHPIYPEPYASEQLKQGVLLKKQLNNIDYLGFNGIWKLNFTTPIFTWIHKVENLGWIYE